MLSKKVSLERIFMNDVLVLLLWTALTFVLTHISCCAKKNLIVPRFISLQHEIFSIVLILYGNSELGAHVYKGKHLFLKFGTALDPNKYLKQIR